MFAARLVVQSSTEYLTAVARAFTFAGGIANRRRLRISDILMFFAFLYLALGARRNLALFGIVAVPILVLVFFLRVVATTASVAGGGVRSFLIPSRPELSIMAKARYGLQAGSGQRTSARVLMPREAGIRTSAERFEADHAM